MAQIDLQGVINETRAGGRKSFRELRVEWGLPPIVPSVQPDDGAALLDELARFVSRFCVFPGEHYVTAMALWIMHTHCIDAFEITPRLAFISETKQTGKSRALEVIDLTAARSRYVGSMSTAYLFRVVDTAKPTLLFDEVDTIFGPKARDHEDLRGLINVGFRRSATVGRCVGDGARQTPTEFAAFAPLAVAGIGDCLPDTVLDRSIVLRMRRRAPDEHVEPLRYRKIGPEAERLRGRLADWAEAMVETLADAYPEMPDGVTDRPADTWEALLAIADTARGDWPARARAACVALNAARAAEDGNVSIRLLADLRRVSRPAEIHVFSVTLCDRLNALEEAPWAAWTDGRGIQPRDLARRLKGFGIHSMQVRVGKDSRKGYAVSAFADTFARYLPAEEDEEEETPSNETAETRETSQVSAFRSDSVFPSERNIPEKGNAPTSSVSLVSPVSFNEPGAELAHVELDQQPGYLVAVRRAEAIKARRAAHAHPTANPSQS
jgi:hypothetical protein